MKPIIRRVIFDWELYTVFSPFLIVIGFTAEGWQPDGFGGHDAVAAAVQLVMVIGQEGLRERVVVAQAGLLIRTFWSVATTKQVAQVSTSSLSNSRVTFFFRACRPGSRRRTSNSP
jgi:hypothetical protein